MKLDALNNPGGGGLLAHKQRFNYNKTVKQHGSDAATEREAFSTAA